AGFGDCLDGERVADVVAARAAPVLWDGDAAQTGGRRRMDDIGRKLASPVDAGGALRHDLARKLLGRFFERELVPAELQNHRCDLVICAPRQWDCPLNAS